MKFKPQDVLRARGRAMSEMDLVRGSVVGTNQRGNAGRKRVVVLALERSGLAGSFVNDNGARYFFLK